VNGVPAGGDKDLAFALKLSDMTGFEPQRSRVAKIMSAWMRPTIIAVVLTPLFGLAALAQTPQFLGSHRDWNVYAFTEDSQKICYMASEPKKQEGDYTRRGDPAVLVTRRPAPKVVDEVSVQPGYSYLEGSEVEVKIGGSTFSLFTRGEHAWTKSEDADQALITAMKRGNDMTVRGTSSRRTYSLDTYSLLGFTAAYDAMVEACRG
jgi:Invasion associated locus B (IalB) protein